MQADFDAPTRGWNARDNFDAVAGGYSLEFVNLIAENGYIRTRGGSSTFVTSGDINAALGATGPIETLEVHNADGTEILIGAMGEYIFGVASNGAITELQDGNQNARYQTMMFNGSLIMVNGQDGPYEFDGTTLTTMAPMDLVDGAKAPIAGISTSDIIGCVSFQNRAIYWLDNEQRFFYADTVNAYKGDCVEFDISGVAERGGKIVSIMDYSRGVTTELDNFLAIHMSTGEMIIYQGSDPGDANSWSLVNSYFIGKPLSIRGNTQMGGDQVIATTDGFRNLTTALPNQQSNRTQDVGDVIIRAAKRAAEKWAGNYGWEAEFFPEKSFLIFNIPRSSTRYEQYVLNTVTKAWSRFTDLNAITWVMYDNKLYYGDPDGNIVEAETGHNDNFNFIVWKLITSFTRLGIAAKSKTVTGASLTHNYKYPSYISIDVMENYNRDSSWPLLAPPETLPARWDASPWDASTWDGSRESVESGMIRTNYPAGASAMTVALKVRGQTKTQQVDIYDFSIDYYEGGNL